MELFSSREQCARVNFVKMQSLGNDFIIIDCRAGCDEEYLLRCWSLDSDDFRRFVMCIAKRRFHVGCDQVIILTDSDKAHCFMHIFNADGSRVGQCGNGARCVIDFLARKYANTSVKGSPFSIEVLDGRVMTGKSLDSIVMVEVGSVSFDWATIPLLREFQAGIIPFSELDIDAEDENLVGAGIMTANVGNPHAVMVVKDITQYKDDNQLSALGRRIESHKLFPEKVNFEVVEFHDSVRYSVETPIRMRVWERGVGITSACGSGACAVASVLLQHKLLKLSSINKLEDVLPFSHNKMEYCVPLCLDGGTLMVIVTDDMKNLSIALLGKVVDVCSGTLAYEPNSMV